MTPPHDPVAAAKAELRAGFLARRRDRSPAERAAGTAAVTSALLRGLAGARTFAAYVPEEVEPGFGRLPAAFTQLGARVLLPPWLFALGTGLTLGMALSAGLAALRSLRLVEPITLLR